MERRTATRRRGIRLAGLLVAGSMAAAACSNSSSSTANEPPSQAVHQAVSNLGAQSSVTGRLSIPLSASQIQQIKDGSGTAPSAQVAKILSGGSIFFTESTGGGEAIDNPKAYSDPKNSFEFGVQLGSDVPLDFRYTGQNAYLLVNLKTLFADAGESSARAASFANALNTVNQYVPGASALGQGKWVEANHASLASLSALFKQYLQSAGVSLPSQSILQRLRASLASMLQSNSTFARLSSNEYAMTLDLRNFLQQFLTMITSFVGSSLPGKYGTEITTLASKAPASATVDLFTSGGRLSAVQLDVKQFAGAHLSSSLPIRLGLSSGSSVSAPSGATPLDLSKLPSLLQGMLSHAA